MTRVLVILFAAILSVSAVIAQPKLEIVGGDTYNWGTVDLKDSPLKAKVKLTNVGNETLKILNVKPGCGCTTAPLDKSELVPGDTATLDVKLNVSKGGDVHKSISITTNETGDSPSGMKKMLFLKADVFTPITVAPAFLSFRRMEVGQEAKSVVTLTNNTKEPIVVKNIKVTPDGVHVGINPETVLEPNKPKAIEVMYTPKKEGRFQTDIILETNSEAMKTIPLRGWGQVIPDMSAPQGKAQTKKK